MKTTRTLLLSTIAAGALVACGDDEMSVSDAGETDTYAAEEATTTAGTGDVAERDMNERDAMGDRTAMGTPDSRMGSQDRMAMNEDRMGMDRSTMPMDQNRMDQDRMGTNTAMQNGPMLTVEVTGVEPGAGDIFVAVQRQDNFAENEMVEGVRVPANGNRVSVPMENLEPGAYAVAVFQDLDGNGELTFDGQTPSEPYGFSGRQQTGAPTFDQAEVDVQDEENPASVSVALRTVNSGERG